MKKADREEYTRQLLLQMVGCDEWVKLARDYAAQAQDPDQITDILVSLAKSFAENVQ